MASNYCNWPVEEIESLRRNEVSLQGIELNKGDLFEIKGTNTLQVLSLLTNQVLTSCFPLSKNSVVDWLFVSHQLEFNPAWSNVFL